MNVASIGSIALTTMASCSPLITETTRSVKKSTKEGESHDMGHDLPLAAHH